MPKITIRVTYENEEGVAFTHSQTVSSESINMSVRGPQAYLNYAADRVVAAVLNSIKEGEFPL